MGRLTVDVKEVDELSPYSMWTEYVAKRKPVRLTAHEGMKGCPSECSFVNISVTGTHSWALQGFEAPQRKLVLYRFLGFILCGKSVS